MAPKKNLFDTLAEDQKDFFIQSLEKKVRNLNKKLKEIKQLLTDRKEGKELKEGQLIKIAAQPELQEKLKEIEGIATLYLEAKAENAAIETAHGNAFVAQAASQIANLYYASQFAHNTNSSHQLSTVYTRLFADHSANRVEFATSELIAYLTGHRSLFEAAVQETINSEAFSQQQTVPVAQPHVPHHVVQELTVSTDAHTHVTHVVVSVQDEVAVSPQTQTVQIVSVEFDEPVVVEDNTANVVVDAVQVEVQQTNEVETDAQGTDAAVQGEAQNQGEDQPRKQRGEGRGEGRGNRKPREPKEHQEDEQPQQEGGEKRAPRPPRTNNRQNREAGEAVDNDGWNVVRKPPTHNEGGNRPYRNKEGAFNKENKTNGGERKPYNPDQKRPYNKERQNGEYVRKDKAPRTNESTTPAVAEQATAKN